MKIVIGAFFAMLALSIVFTLAATGWGNRSHSFRAALSFIGLLLCLPVAVVCLMILSGH